MIIGFIMALILLIDCMAFHIISKDELSDKKQKILQCLLVFFVPLLGSLLVITVIKNKPQSEGKYPEIYNNDSDPSDLGIEHFSHDTSAGSGDD